MNNSQRLESELKYRILFDNADDAILVWKVNEELNKFVVIEANQVACDRYGYAHNEIIGLTGEQLNTPESLVRNSYVGTALARNGHVTAEITHLTKYGKPILNEVRSHLFSLNGERVIISVCRDVSEREELERQRQELLQRERRLREKAEADTLMRANYVRALAHELKTPLTSLMASSEHLMDELKDGPLNEFAKNICYGADRINNRIEELHDMVRLESGNFNLPSYPVDMKQLLLNAVAFVKPTAVKGEISLEATIPNELPLVCGDTERLQQVVLNLLNNALKYTPKGGAVWLKATVGQRGLIVEVGDTGCGIPKTDQNDLFQPYNRRHPKQQKVDGLGLGLVIAKAIIERYGGRIWLESQPSNGSRFFIAMPIITPEANCEGARN
ncbi:MAG: PAS domain-containing sensor histidine kinase [Dehalogenimonas sp.]